MEVFKIHFPDEFTKGSIPANEGVNGELGKIFQILSHHNVARIFCVPSSDKNGYHRVIQDIVINGFSTS